jgi:hypothetical protein
MHCGFQFTKEALRGDLGVEVVQCERADIQRELANTTVIVPLMSPLDAQVRVELDFLNQRRPFGGSTL